VEAMTYLKNEGQFKNKPRPELILLDLNLQRINGVELLAKIKNSRSLRKIKS